MVELEKDKAGNSVQIEEKELEKDSIELKITKPLSISHTTQDPWILNPNAARDFIFTK
ncbi:hypothetical protein ACLHDG_08175 [Sulfurovum sp. CS9]|uniref:hypothetical protein n=1 Tax=Sulfurovum sp. CS9 TaxID=3391146 RepID=UPI0039E79094